MLIYLTLQFTAYVAELFFYSVYIILHKQEQILQWTVILSGSTFRQS